MMTISASQPIAVCLLEKINSVLQTAAWQGMVQTVLISDRKGFQRARRRLDPQKSFVRLLALSPVGQSFDSVFADDNSAAFHGLVQSSRDQARLLITQRNWPQDLLGHLQGVIYWRLLQEAVDEGPSSLHQLTANILEHLTLPGEGQSGDSHKHYIPLGMLRDSPGTFGFLEIR